MTATPSQDPPWGLLPWATTALASAFASAIAFGWRLASRLERVETAQSLQRAADASLRSSHDAATQRLAERLDLAQNDLARLREILGALPTRADLRDLEARLADQLAGLAARLDRAIDD